MITSNKEAKEVIEGLMKGLSRFRRFIFVNSTLADLYNHAIPALEKAQDYLDRLDGQDCQVAWEWVNPAEVDAVRLRLRFDTTGEFEKELLKLLKKF